MTLLHDLLSTSRTIYERQRDGALAEMKREARNLAGTLREESRENELLREARGRDDHWRRILTDLRDERERRDQAIRQFCRRAETAAMTSADR